MVFYSVFTSPGQELGNLYPLVSKLFMGRSESCLFFLSPWAFDYFLPQVVHISLPTLFPTPLQEREGFGNLGPALNSVLRHQGEKLLVLDLVPERRMTKPKYVEFSNSER